MKITDILESLNYKSKIEWKNDGYGYFVINNHNFRMQVRQASENEKQTFIPFFKEAPKVGNVDFEFQKEDGTYTQDTTGILGASSMKVFSVVAQGVAEQIKNNGYEILLCIAKRSASPTGFESRMSSYETIVERAARKSGMSSIAMPSPDGTALFIVYHPKYTENILKVKNHLQQHYSTKH